MFDGHNLILIVGAPRSGTTWLQKLLASHPLIKTGQESDVFDVYIGPQLRAWRIDLSAKKSGRGGVGLGCYFTEDVFMRNLKNYVDILLEPMLGNLGDNELFLEKTPRHALYIPEIIELLPQVRIIHILRDGRDVTASLLFASRSWGKVWAPQKPKAAARMWAKHVEAIKNTVSLIPQEQFYELRYEQLYNDPPGVLRSLSNFLGLDWEERALLEAINKNMPEAKLQSKATKIPLFGEMAIRNGNVVKDPDEFIHKPVPGSWRKDLSLWEKIQVWRTARTLLTEMGYPFRFRDILRI